MAKVLGIDTSNYTTSVAIVDNNQCVFDARKLLSVDKGERGLRQSDALFQHIKNLPELLNNEAVKNIQAVCASTRPRPIEGSYMPVFNAGDSLAKSLSHVLGIKMINTTHQEGHIEAAFRSSGMTENIKEFICLHLSGGTTEVLNVKRYNDYEIEIIGKTRDISAGQFIDRSGVAMGYKFPCGKNIDNLAMICKGTSLRIPSRVNVMDMNFSGQESLCLKYINDGYNQEDIAYALMLCISKTLEKVIDNIKKNYKKPILITGGVASSSFIKNFLNERYRTLLYFSESKVASDNAVGVAFIGYKNIMEAGV